MREFITLGGGCFWCIEAVFENVDGVKSATSGYMGGKSENPTYEDICRGDTEHVEVVRVEFDTNVISLERLLDIFLTIHDPTSLNRQGNDTGTQYRSAIFYENEVQKTKVLEVLKKANKNYTSPIVTTVEKAPVFYKAEEYHQSYFKKNPNDGYCNFAIPPKLKKLREGEF